MAKSSPEKLAQALRANLRRRKQAQAAGTKEPASDNAKSTHGPGRDPAKTPIKRED